MWTKKNCRPPSSPRIARAPAKTHVICRATSFLRITRKLWPRLLSRRTLAAMPEISSLPARFRVLGVDPASAGATGYAIVEAIGNHCTSISFGVIPAARDAARDLPGRLHEIHTQIARLIDEFTPAQVALEAIFAALNVKTALRLAHVCGEIRFA